MFRHPVPVMGAPKRIFDVIASLAGLVLLALPMVVVAIIIRLSSPGPALFSQQRVGRNEKPFICYKFRTMHVGTEQRATHEISQSAITTAGKTLRRFKLDELPQLWNVLRGDMSIVGPRPCLAVQKELVSEREKRGVYALRPGITGLAQVQGVDMSDPKKLAEIDADYLKRQGFGLDLGIILRTIFKA